jgi:ankyrin repeat protein
MIASDDGSLALHVAAEAGHTGAVRAMWAHLKDSAPGYVNAERCGYHPIHLAAAAGHSETVRTSASPFIWSMIYYFFLHVRRSLLFTA